MRNSACRLGIALLLFGCTNLAAPVNTLPPTPTATPNPALSAPTAGPAGLTLEHSPVGQVLPAGVGPIKALEFGKEFRYVGGQRFVLRKTADAEQHFFVDADENKAIRRLYWIQFEELLPGIGTEYDYSADETVTVNGVSFQRNVRGWRAEPEPDSDRGAMTAFLEKRGYRTPSYGTLRVRLVHVPVNNRREELMIIYAQAALVGRPLPSESDVQRGALEKLRVVATAP